MPASRFFIQRPIKEKEVKIKDKELIHRWKNVLRVKEKDKVSVFNNSDGEFLAEVKEIKNNSITLEIIKKIKNRTEPETKIHLFQALIKKDGFELVVEKGTEAGIFSFTPIITDRTEKKNIKMERLKKIAAQAAEQSKRGRVPKINTPISFKEAILNLNSPSFLLDSSGQHITEYSRKITDSQELNLLVGPEGGWTEEEIETAKKSVAEIANLGPRTLKSETAGTLASAFILNLKKE